MIDLKNKLSNSIMFFNKVITCSCIQVTLIEFGMNLQV